MKNNRREFLKVTGLAGLAGFFGYGQAEKTGSSSWTHHEKFNRRQRFNMHGYAAPALDVVRVGVIGIGNRGSGTLRRLASIEGVEIKALSDLEEDRVRAGIASVSDEHSPDGYYGGEEEWKRLCDREDIDLVVINTPWHLHAIQTVYAMEHEKHAAVEIPAANTIDECWELIETSERTRQHCFQMTNVCYSFFEMITLNMARQGFFGEIIHGEGAYIHQLLSSNFSRDAYHNMWRLRENATRNGNLYPHHGLGTMAQIMDINHGDKMDFMVSMSSDDFMMGEKARELAETDSFFEKFAEKDFRGNMNTTTIRTHRGRTMMLQHDVTSPRPYSRIHLISGTEAIAMTFPAQQIATSHDGWLPEEEFERLTEKYTPEITKRVGELARQVGGHGGMDTLLVWRLVDCLRNGIPLDMNVYDAALWSAVIPLSEWSVANGSQPVEIPDFTSGAWETNEPGMDIELERGGTTRIVS